MIPRAYITEWRNVAPWSSDAQVEQDLIISRMLVELFSNRKIADSLVFRGGTALYKLFAEKPARYSEDIDLVQSNSAPIGDVMTEIRNVCESMLQPDGHEQKKNSVRLYYKTESEIPPIIPIKIKIEINTREHFGVYDINHKKYESNSRWHSGVIDIPIYCIEELLGTKLRALYQRNKGRDLFDLWYAIKNYELDFDKIVNSFKKYIEYQGVKISSKEYIQNLDAKMNDSQFIHDIDNLIHPEIKYSAYEGYESVMSKIIGFI